MRNWERKPIKDVVIDLHQGLNTAGYKIKFYETGYPIIQTRNLENGVIDIDEKIKHMSEEDWSLYKDKYKPNIGDVFLTNIGTIGKTAVVDKDLDYLIHWNIFIFKLNKKLLDPYYLKAFLDTPFCFNYYLRCQKGGTVNFITKKMIEVLEIPLPPLSEQQRIVAILDKAFAAIDKAKTNAEKNLRNAKELFESYLQGVFDNKGDSWVNASIGETCNLQTGGTPSTSKKEFYEGGSIKWLVSGDINQKVIYDCEGRITELGMKSSNAKFLHLNSVLIALNGQGKTRGTVAMLRTKATCNQSLVAIYPKDEKSLLPELVFSNLEGRYDEIRKMTGDSGNDRRGLNMPLIRSIKFSYPKKISEQNEIIIKLDNLRDETKRLESIYQQKLTDLEELKKSILQKAFNGELNTAEICA